MKTYTTDEGIRHCSNCGTALSNAEILADECSKCWQLENEDMSDDDEENIFAECSRCDGHPACEDFGCAFKLGLGHLIHNDEFF